MAAAVWQIAPDLGLHGASAALNVIISGTTLTALTVGLTYHRRALGRLRQEGRQELQGVAQALVSIAEDPVSGWSMLLRHGVIDGYAVWDSQDRLVASAGFLHRYMPQLAEWHNPTARQVITELVASNLIFLAPETDHSAAIDAYCRQRLQLPGLREFRMADGQCILARTAPLGNGRHASIYTNVTGMVRWSSGGLLPEKLYREAFESASSMLLVVGPDAMPLAMNRAAAAGLGYSLSEVQSLGWTGLLHPDEGRPSTPWPPGPHWFKTASGSRMRGMVRSAGIRESDGPSCGLVLVTIDDITERWATEERQRLQSALAGSLSIAVVATDRAGRITYSNSAAAAMFHWSSPILLRTQVERILGSAVQAAIAGPQREITPCEIDCEGTTWSGGRFPAQVAIAPLADGPQGQEGGAVLVVTDQTPRRALDLQLMHSARLATLGEMAASIAHEFNQCLHVIRLSAEALQMDLGQMDQNTPLETGTIAKRTGNILSQVDRLGEMVSHMRAISRREDAAQQPFQPESALTATLRMMEPLLQGDGIRVDRHGELGGAVALGHKVRLEQVLLNLLNNARDAIRDRFRQQGNSGGLITVTCTIDDQEGHLQITVQDDGTGVPQAMTQHIFEPFFTTKASGAGCGLGLSISRGICAEMGGGLSFTSSDAGAAFTIRLPLAEPRPATLPDASPALGSDEDEDDWGDERRLLLVDDEAISVLMVSEFLQRQGYQVDTAYDGLNALHLCQNHVYHAVVTDIRMPRMDGRELIARLNDLQPGTPVIVVTGHLYESDAITLGANVAMVLEKPFQLHTLRDVLLRLDETRFP